MFCFLKPRSRPWGFATLFALATWVFVAVAGVAADEEQDAWSLIDQGPSRPLASFSGDFQHRMTFDLVSDNADEDMATTRELLFGKALFSLSDRLSVTLSGLGEYMLRADRQMHATGARYRADLEEFYADVHLGRLDLRLGQQIVAWGKADVINPTDVINSQDMRYMIDSELGHTRVPNLMARADYYAGPFSFEGILIPFFRPARVDFIGGDWALLGNRVPVTQLTGYLDESVQGRLVLRVLNHFAPDWDDALEETLSSERLNVLGPTPPFDDLHHGEAAAKIDATFGPAAGSFSYFYGYEDLPTLQFSPAVRSMLVSVLEGRMPTDLSVLLDDLDSLTFVEATYPRIHQIGHDFSVNLGPSVVRWEAAYTVGRLLYTRELKTEKQPTLTYTAAADFTLPGDALLNCQVLGLVTPGWTEALLTERAYTFLIAYLRDTFFEDKVEVYAEVLYNVTGWSTEGWRAGEVFDEDYQVTAKVNYDLLSDLTLGFGAMVFGGPRDQLLALVRERNFGFVDLKYSF